MHGIGGGERLKFYREVRYERLAASNIFDYSNLAFRPPDRGNFAMMFTQGRVFASSPDEAALMIRDKHEEYQGSLTVSEVPSYQSLRWFEYRLQLIDGKFYDNRG